MSRISLVQILTAIRDTLAPAPTLVRTQGFDELSEGIHDMPLLQVYPETGVQDPASDTDRTTFGAGVRQTDITIHADYYARQRSHMAEDMAALVAGVDAITNIMEEQDSQPFGLEGIKAFRWHWQRVKFLYGDPQLPYVGVRFVIVLRVF